MGIYKALGNGKKGTNSHGALRNCLEYVLSPAKTNSEYCYMIGPYTPNSMDFNSVYGSFLDVKKEWDKDDKRMYAHTVISFPPNEAITPEQALEFGIRFAEKTYDGYQVAVAVHLDKEHTHIHFVINSVSYVDGKKFQMSRNDLKRDKEYCNELCAEYGYSIAEKGKHADNSPMKSGEITAWSKDKYHLLTNLDKPSYVSDCGLAVLRAMETATSKETFISAMADSGWTTEWSDSRKHIVFKNADGKKVRDSNIQKTFNINCTKGELENEFIRKNSERATRARTQRTNDENDRGTRTKNRDKKPERSHRGKAR